MPFVLVLPFIVIGLVITVVKKTAEQNKRVEAQRRAEQAQMQQRSAQKPAQQVPVRPSVQAPPVRKAEPTLKPTPTVQKTYQSPLAQPTKKMHPEHEYCAIRPDPPKGKTHPDHDLCSLTPEEQNKKAPHAQTAPAPGTAETTLDFTPDNILRGVIFAEVFGRPKALR